MVMSAAILKRHRFARESFDRIGFVMMSSMRFLRRPPDTPAVLTGVQF
jgi:hypothetical protein